MGKSSEIVRLAIIGLGHIGKVHIKAIQQFEELKLVAACDRHRDHENMVPEGILFYVDYEQMLRDGGFDTVIIATPNHTHYFISKKVLEAGYHAIIEKPAAENMSELLELDKVSSKRNLSVFYAFHAATSFDVEWFSHYLLNKKYRDRMGPITGFLSRFYDPYISNGQLEEKASGLQNPWLDSGINALSVIQRFIPLNTLKIENASAALNNPGKPRFSQCHVEYSFSINGQDRSGFGVIDTNWTAGRNHKSTVLQFGKTDQSVLICHSTQQVTLINSDGKKILLADCSQGKDRLYNHYLGVFKEFLTCLQNKRMNGDKTVELHNILFLSERAINKPLLS